MISPPRLPRPTRSPSPDPSKVPSCQRWKRPGIPLQRPRTFDASKELSSRASHSTLHAAARSQASTHSEDDPGSISWSNWNPPRPLGFERPLASLRQYPGVPGLCRQPRQAAGSETMFIPSRMLRSSRGERGRDILKRSNPTSGRVWTSVHQPMPSSPLPLLTSAAISAVPTTS